MYNYCFQEEGPDDKAFNYGLLNEFAIGADLSDALLLLAIYKRFANDPSTCTECKETKSCKKRKLDNHANLHEHHFKNAKVFITLKDQERVCQCAVDCVLAERRFKSVTLTRNEIFADRVKQVMKKIKDILDDVEQTDKYVAAMILLNMLIPQEGDRSGISTIADILETMIKNPPKQRYYIFRGPVNTGKTTLAAAIVNLLGGTTLNVNGNPERLNFELGCAIDCFIVLFEDVKGTPLRENSRLPLGLGVSNLDNLRDHLDGHVPVNLERKHQNKIAQVFPPGLITMNEYKIPQTLRVRCKQIIEFRNNASFAKALAANMDIMNSRLLTSAETLLGLLLVFSETEARFQKTLLMEHKLLLEVLKMEFDNRVMRYNTNLWSGDPFWIGDPAYGPTEQDEGTSQGESGYGKSQDKSQEAAEDTYYF